MRDKVDAPKKPPLPREVQDAPDTKNSAAFSAFFRRQTIASARVAIGLGIAAFVLTGAADVSREMQIPALSAYRGLITVPAAVIAYAASYASIAQRYWQTFLSIVGVAQGLVLFNNALVSYSHETPFQMERWLVASMVIVAVGALLPLRLLNAAVISVFALGLLYLFLFWTNQWATLWMQFDFGVTLCVFCAAAYFRERVLWMLFASTEGQRTAPHGH